MFKELLIFSIVFNHIAQSLITNHQQSHSPVNQKQSTVDVDFDLNDKKLNIEGSGATVSLDEYADEDEDDQLSKFTVTTITASTTISTTTTTTAHKTILNETHTKSTDSDNEFNEEYKDDLVDDIDYNEITKISTTTISISTTISNSPSIRVIFNFLTRPKIAAGILLGLAIGIFVSVILLICIIQRFNKRERSNSSYTTGLLYPSQYGYSKSPQEFYA